ncbi:ankyrin repeat domain-containing protein [Ehrlichia canis]|uniref:ankyrin repeat domain-containing protein n=2 Tax=Ehrlichia canis TaxID=944 RepID=UPI000C820123|nr:ankyrin repeat domain-containing protein [Ehrlichia canis]AUO54356.1 ankyrin repeat domain-containing protein [Ehrlichia canis]UKC53057.1 ankyrin repeat domain-containing protein [Ehrlichia canis]UKC53994.1 ankyrin repeat domain-containing protein [Ehrlichia canis]UKC54930.1 ankyrin repeat domain-containing protein [Ehrlichia canis]
MLMMHKIAVTRYVKPLILSKILNEDKSFLKMLESLESEDILLLKNELGTVFYYLIMSLYDISGIKNNSSNTLRARLKELLSEAIDQSSMDQGRVVASQVSDIKDITSKLKLAYQSISNSVYRTLFNVLDSDETSEEEVDPQILRQRQLEYKAQMFECVIQAVRILADKINKAVAEQKISPEQVSEFLAYSDRPCDPLVPDAMSALAKLYFLIEDPQLSELAYSLVKEFLIGFSQYRLDKCGRNALHYAVNICNTKKQESFLCEIIQLLIYNRVEILNELDVDGNNPMHYVACAPYLNRDIVKYFLKNAPAMIVQQNSHGDTPLHIMSSVYLINFAKILSFYNITYRDNMWQLKDVMDLSLSEMRDVVMSVRGRDEELSSEIKNYLVQCVDAYRLLLTSVPLWRLFEVRDERGHTVYDIMTSAITSVGDGNLKALLEDFSEMSSRLPIYDSRIHAQNELCVKLCFDKKNIGKNRYGHSLYKYTKYIHDLIYSKFAKISESRARCHSLKKERNGFKFVSLFVIAVFILLCVLNAVLHFKERDILWCEKGVYRSVLFAVISIVFFTAVCVAYALYAKQIDCCNDKAMMYEKENIRGVLLSHLNIEAIGSTKEINIT